MWLKILRKRDIVRAYNERDLEDWYNDNRRFGKQYHPIYIKREAL